MDNGQHYRQSWWPKKKNKVTGICGSAVLVLGVLSLWWWRKKIQKDQGRFSVVQSYNGTKADLEAKGDATDIGTLYSKGGFL